MRERGERGYRLSRSEELRSERGHVTKETICAGIIEEVYLTIGSRQKMS